MVVVGSLHGSYCSAVCLLPLFPFVAPYVPMLVVLCTLMLFRRRAWSQYFYHAAIKYDELWLTCPSSCHPHGQPLSRGWILMHAQIKIRRHIKCPISSLWGRGYKRRQKKDISDCSRLLLTPASVRFSGPPSAFGIAEESRHAVALAKHLPD